MKRKAINKSSEFGSVKEQKYETQGCVTVDTETASGGFHFHSDFGCGLRELTCSNGNCGANSKKPRVVGLWFYFKYVKIYIIASLF